MKANGYFLEALHNRDKVLLVSPGGGDILLQIWYPDNAFKIFQLVKDIKLGPPIWSALNLACRFVDQAPLIVCILLLCTCRVNTYLFELGLRFELLAKDGVEELLEGRVHEASRLDQPDDVHFLLEGGTSLFHCNLLSFLVAADQLARQHPNAILFDALRL